MSSTIGEALGNLYLTPTSPFPNKNATKALSEAELRLQPRLKQITRSNTLVDGLQSLYNDIARTPLNEDAHDFSQSLEIARKTFMNQRAFIKAALDGLADCNTEAAARDQFRDDIMNPILKLLNYSQRDNCTTRGRWMMALDPESAASGVIPDWTMICKGRNKEGANFKDIPSTFEFKRWVVLLGDHMLNPYVNKKFKHPTPKTPNVGPVVQMFTQFWAHMVVAHEVPLAIVCNGKCVWFLHRETQEPETLFISQPKPFNEDEKEDEDEDENKDEDEDEDEDKNEDEENEDKNENEDEDEDKNEDEDEDENEGIHLLFAMALLCAHRSNGHHALL
ncbi:hypothetical protein K439DRAFT_1615134 [Ramaria rubella]|nr:hypothetical protein K439DRAFT_1615134 [Ramaria rubella]